MSVLERVRQLQMLAKQQQQSKVPPIKAPPAKLFTPKIQPPKPTNTQHVKPNNIQKTQTKNTQPLIKSEQPKTLSQQIIKKQQLKPIEVVKKQFSKSQQVIKQNSHENNINISTKDPQVVVSQPVQGIGKVKGLRDLFQKKQIPIAMQPAPVMKSCFVVKNNDRQKIQQKTSNNEQKQKIQEPPRVSLPATLQNNAEQKIPTFKQLQALLAVTFNKTKMMPKKTEQKQNNIQTVEQNHENTEAKQPQQHQANKIKITLPQQTYTFEQGQTKKQEDESQKLFQQALKQKEQNPTTLISGQSSNLNLATRRTIARKKRNDFDDL